MPAFTNDYRKSITNSDAAAQVAAFKASLEEEQKASSAAAASKTEKKDEVGFLDSVTTFIKELPEQLAGGVNDAINNTIEAARDAGEGIGIPNYALQYKNEKGEWDWEFLSEKEVAEKGGLEKVIPEFKEASTTGGQMLRAITQFATGFIPAAKGLQAAGAVAKVGKVASGMIAGGVADAVTADPHQERLATFLNEVPALGAIIPDYIADNNPNNEGEWEGRIKNVIEGAVLGGASEVLIAKIVKMFKAYKVAQIAKKASGETGPLTPEDAVKQMDEMTAAKEAAQEEFAAKQLPPKMSDEEVAVKTAEAEKRGTVFINMDRINGEDDVKAMMQRTADLQADRLTAGDKTFKGIRKASHKQMKDVNDLLSHPTDRPFTPEEAVAARSMMIASAENMTIYGHIASQPGAGPVDLFNFKKAQSIDAEIQAKVFAGRKATAQTQASWRIEAKSTVGRLRSIQTLMDTKVTQETLDNAKMLADLSAQGKTPVEVAKSLRQSTMKRWDNALYQVWINGKLSSPSTHLANILGNSATTIMAIPERYATAAFETLSSSNGNALVEANARAAGFFTGIKDGISLMTGSTKHEALTNATKFDTRMNPISAAEWGVQPDTTIGKGIDYLGKATSMPGWALQKVDNFYKGINYRMMLNEQANKQAYSEGLTGKAYKMRVADLVANPTNPIQDVSIDFARYQTFTDTPGMFTTGIQLATANSFGVGKYVLPFIKTPSRIMSYGFERTPLAPLVGDNWSKIKVGGSDAAEVYARMSAGSLLMAGFADATLNGKITGSGPANWDQRRTLEATGWQPYSIKVGDRYISYERLEPLASLVAYSSDITTILGQTEDEAGNSLVAAGLTAFARNFGSKSFVRGSMELSDVLNSGSPKKIEKYLQRQTAGMIQPFYSAAIQKGNNYFDDVKRDYTPDSVNGFLKSTFMLASENIPGIGRSAPILKDVWGEDQHYSNGIAEPLDQISPIRLSADKKDPINNMIAENSIALKLPTRIIEGVQLTNVEYSKYSEKAGKIARRGMEDNYNAGLFEGISGGPDGEISLIVRTIFQSARKEAADLIKMDSPDLEDRIYKNKLEIESKLIGE